MKKVGIRFRKTGKLSFYISENDDIKVSDSVVAETEKGEEIGIVAKVIDIEEKDKELEKIKRLATKEDLKNQETMNNKAREALKFCKEQAKNIEQELNLYK